MARTAVKDEWEVAGDSVRALVGRLDDFVRPYASHFGRVESQTTPAKGGGLMGGTASKAVGLCVVAPQRRRALVRIDQCHRGFLIANVGSNRSQLEAHR